MRHYKPFGITLLMVPVLVMLPFSTHGPKNMVFAQDQGVQTKEPANSPAQSKEEMETYKKDLEKELRSLDKKIATLGQKVKKRGSKVEAEAKESWNDLKVKQRAARSKLKALSSAGKEAWGKAKAEADAARDELKGAYDKAASHFK